MKAHNDTSKEVSAGGKKLPPAISEPETATGNPPGAKNYPQVSRFARFVITWVVFIPLELPFMGGDFGQSAVPQAIGAAFAVAGISWLVTVGMKPTKSALASMLCVALALYVISTAGRFVGSKSENSSRNGSHSVQPTIPMSVRESLEKTARQINSQAPMRVDKYTLLNSASFSGRTAMYRNSLEVEVSDQEFRELLQGIRPLTVDNFKRNPSDAIAFAKYGIVVIYQYTDKGGKVMNLELDFAKDPDLAWAR